MQIDYRKGNVVEFSTDVELVWFLVEIQHLFITIYLHTVLIVMDGSCYITFGD